jgi:CRP-like cAMP-binding protein
MASKFPQTIRRIHIKKGEVLQHAGDRNSKVYYVLDGLLRSYTLDEKGKEHVFMFAPEGWIIADIISPEKPAELFIDAMEDSVVSVREKNLEEEVDMHKLVKRMGVLQKRIIMLMSASALERYEHFLETYPDIVQRVPQRHIASYLGITPEALSKIKSEQAKRV